MNKEGHMLELEHTGDGKILVYGRRGAGLHTSAWGVNEEAALARVLALGLDSFGTDRPRWAREIRKHIG